MSKNKPINIDIKFMSPDGKTLEDRPDCHTIPIIKLLIRAGTKYNLYNPLPGGEVANVLALIDTGADDCYVDEAFANRLLMPEIGKTELMGATSTIESGVVNTQIKFSNSEEMFGTTMIKTPLRANGRKYDVIIGMKIIKLGALIMDPSRSIYTLTFRS